MSRILSLWGHTIVPTHETWQHQWESTLRNSSPEIVFDVGANVGQWYLALREVNKLAKVYSFEPDPRAFKVLAELHRTVEDPNWYIFETALGSSDGQSSMNLWDVEGGSSSLKDLTFEGESFTGKQQSDFERIDVQITSLDSFIRNQGTKFEKVMLKLDVQGYELEVLLGASESLLGCVELVEVEIPFRSVYKGESNVSTIDGLLGAKQFTPLTYQTKRWNNEVLAAADFDALYIRNSK